MSEKPGSKEGTEMSTDDLGRRHFERGAAEQARPRGSICRTGLEAAVDREMSHRHMPGCCRTLREMERERCRERLRRLFS